MKWMYFGEKIADTNIHIHTLLNAHTFFLSLSLFFFLISSLINLSHSLPPFLHADQFFRGRLSPQRKFSWLLLDIYPDLCISLVKPLGKYKQI